MSVENVNPASRDVLDCAGDLMQAFAQPELSVFRTNQPIVSESKRAALWLAVALGRCRLFGVDLGQHDGVLPPRIALAAAEECSRQLRDRAEKAITLAQDFETKPEGPVEENVGGELDCALELGHFFFVCMDLWAALVALDEAYDACIIAEDNSGAALERAITETLNDSDALDEAMQDNVDTFCVVAETSLLENWRSLLVEPYRSMVPWWLDGTLETANEYRKLREGARTQYEMAISHHRESPTSLQIVGTIDAPSATRATDNARRDIKRLVLEPLPGLALAAGNKPLPISSLPQSETLDLEGGGTLYCTVAYDFEGKVVVTFRSTARQLDNRRVLLTAKDDNGSHVLDTHVPLKLGADGVVRGAFDISQLDLKYRHTVEVSLDDLPK